jgi:tetratricopeptide (TPR) repeat protein
VIAALLLAAVAGPVVVLPPEAARGESGWVAELVADMLPTALQQLGVPVVERAERLRAQEALDIPAVSLSRATQVRVAEALGASRLVIGGHELAGAQLTLALRLVDVERGTLSAPLMAAGPIEGLAELVYGLAYDIALTGPARPARSRADFLAARPALPFDAMRAYAEGLAGRDAASRVKALKRALTLAPGCDEARLALGRFHLQARTFREAHEALARVGTGGALGRSAQFLDGVALLELGRYREAAALYARLATLEPTPAALNNHALALLRLPPGEVKDVKASQVLRKAAELDPASLDLPFNLGWALLVEGDAEAAAFWMRGVARQEPRDAHARVVLAWALAKSGKGAEADEAWKGVVALSPGYDVLASPDFSRRFERILASERALALDREERSDAEMAVGLVGHASRLADQGDLTGAQKELMRAAYLDPYGARVHQQLGRVHGLQGDRETALRELRMSLWCREDSVVRLELAALLKGMGRAAEAKAEAQKVLRAEPGNEAARRLLESP